MRASMSSASGCVNVSNVRTAGPPGFAKVLVIWKGPPTGSSPKNIRSTAACAPSRQLCPEVHSGYGAVRSAVQVASGSVAAFPSSNVVVIAFHGRQKSKWYLSFQQLIAASAPLRFCSARSLALSAASRSVRAMSCRATSFQLRTGALCHHLAMYVCSSVRVEPVARPRLLTSLNSVAHCGLSSAGGGAERNCEELWMRNGLTLPTHGVGSRAATPPGTSGCQCPTAEFGTHGDGPNRPSPSLASSIALAAACPIAMPCFLNESSSIDAREAAYAEESVLRSPARPGNGALSGAVETSSESTS